MPNGEDGLIHVEYDFAGNGHVKFLQVWSSTTRGWRLICSYSTSDSGFESNAMQFEKRIRRGGIGTSSQPCHAPPRRISASCKPWQAGTSADYGAYGKRERTSFCHRECGF